MPIAVGRASVSHWTLRIFASLLVMAPIGARAQVVATSFGELEAVLKRGDRIEVTDASGRRTKGRLGELSAASLELLVRKTAPDGSEVFVPQARLGERDVQQIRLEHRDSILNGTLIGFAPGAVIGTMILFLGAGCDCYTIESRAPLAFGTMLIAGGIGAGIGAMIDSSMVERTTVYFRAGPRSVGLRLQPLVSSTATGVGISVRF
jgi:hypothetical protein